VIANLPGAGAEPERFATVAVISGAMSGRSEELTYRVPAGIGGQVERGTVVWAPLRDHLVTGIVLGVTAETPAFSTREIVGADFSFRLSEAQLAVAGWIARETATTLGLAASLFFPPGLEQRAEERLVALPETGFETLTPIQAQTLSIIRSEASIAPDELRKRTKRALTSVIPALIAEGLVERRVEIVQPVRRATSERQVRVSEKPRPDGLKARQASLLREISLRARAGGEDGWISARIAVAASSATRDTIDQLVRLGLIEERRVHQFATPTLDVTPDVAPSLTPDQQHVWESLSDALAAGSSSTLLLRGVTGSGKTELYLRAIGWCLRNGRQAIILAPEIALASQLVRRVAARFPEQTAILHSGLNPSERLDTWLAIAAGERNVVVGPRSALFAPLSRIGLIVLDEEHEPAYKQESEPRYHTRAVAERLAGEHDALVILGSATPSIETAARAARGEIREVRLRSRVNPVSGNGEATLDLPEVEIVDLRLELHRGNPSLISDSLKRSIDTALTMGEQALLFLNRRGTATVVLCGDCGHTLMCPFCDIPHVYHEDRKRLICHRCGYSALPPHRCPKCTGHLQFLGAGTQRLTQIAQATFPKARVARWDQDAVRKRGAQEKLLHQIERREIDIIVGTQMIAKGLDLPHVTVVGVIQADSLLQLPDFRAAERTFQLVTQVAGRAGRRRSGGRVVVQSYHPAHYAILAAANHDVDAFYAEEIEFRRRQRYPPFTRMIRFAIRRSSDEQCATESDNLVRLLVHHANARNIEIELLGPTPAFAYRIAGHYQWQLILRTDPDDMERLLNDFPSLPGWVVDVDPMQVI
jgi:primosomal protein N' (replication factor Y)